MECPSCRVDVPEASRFCPGCGHPLPLVCPACGSPAPAGGHFCPACGKRIAAAEGGVGEHASEASLPQPSVEGTAAAGEVTTGLPTLPPGFLFGPFTPGVDVVLGTDGPPEQDE